MKQVLWFIKTYVTFVVLYVLQKPFFLIVEKASATEGADHIFSDMPAVIPLRIQHRISLHMVRRYHCWRL